MTYVVADRVKETTTTTGAGSLSLGGAVAGFNTFIAGVGNANQCPYCLLSGNGTDWETGIATITSGAPNILARAPVKSSNANAAIVLTGTSTVFVTASAALIGYIGGPIIPPPVAASWAQRNFGGTTTFADVSGGVRIFTSSASAGITNVLRAVTVAAPATPYTIDMNLNVLGLMAGSQFIKAGGLWFDGTKAIAHLAQFNGGVMTVTSETYTNLSTYSAGVGGSYPSSFGLGDVWFRLADDGTNVTYSFSLDGLAWLQIYTTTKAAGFLGASGYTNVGFYVNEQVLGNGGFIQAVLKSWWVH